MLKTKPAPCNSYPAPLPTTHYRLPTQNLHPLKQSTIEGVTGGYGFGDKVAEAVTLFNGEGFSLDRNVEETLFEFGSEMSVGD